MRLFFMVALLLVMVFLVGGCKSVATTSAILRNQEGNYDLAIEQAKLALEQNPNDAEAYFQLGISYSNLDSVDLAYRYFKKSMELDKKKKELANDNILHNFAKHYNRGQSAFNRDDFATSAHEFEKATQADPRQSRGFYNLGVAYDRLADEDSSYYEKALAALDRVLELATPSDPNYIPALKVAGKVLAEVGRVDEAISRFNRLIEEDPTNYGVLEALGGERMKEEDWKGAHVFLEMAAKARSRIGADDFNLFYNLGAVNFNMFNVEKNAPEAITRAITYYQEALDLEPDDPQTIYNIMLCHFAKKDWKGAASWGERYVGLRPEDERAWRRLAMSYTQMNEEDKARSCAIKYEELMKKKGRAE